MEGYREVWEGFLNYSQNNDLNSRFQSWKATYLASITDQNLLSRINEIERELQTKIDQLAKSLELSGENYEKFKTEAENQFHKMRDLRLKKNQINEKRESTIQQINSLSNSIAELVEKNRDQKDPQVLIDISNEIKQKINDLDKSIDYIQNIDNFLDHFWQDWEEHLNTIRQKYSSQKASQDLKAKQILNFVEKETQEIQNMMRSH